MLYEDIKEMIEQKAYTIVQCQNMLNNYYKYMQLTDDQYDELMELSKQLDPNSSSDMTEIRFTQIETAIADLKTQVESILAKLQEGGTIVPEPTEADGSEFNPIMAYAGMTYYKGKYYIDPNNNEVYQCSRDNDTSPGSGITLNYVPSQLVNIYFNWVRKEA